MMITTDISGGLRRQVRRALDIISDDAASFRSGVRRFGLKLERILKEMQPLEVALALVPLPGTTPLVPRTDPLRALLETLTDASLSDPELAQRLDSQLGDAWNDLFERYEAHQLRQARLLQAYLDDEELLDWLDVPVEDALGRLELGCTDPTRYPADEAEILLRFRGSIWNILAGIRAVLTHQEHEGWIHFELALLLAEEFRRRHLEEDMGIAVELERATTEGNEVELEMWEDFRRGHDSRYTRWWGVFGPVHDWLSQRLELCPTGLDRVFNAFGEDVWEMSMPDLLDQAREILV